MMKISLFMFCFMYLFERFSFERGFFRRILYIIVNNMIRISVYFICFYFLNLCLMIFLLGLLIVLSCMEFGVFLFRGR